MSEKEETAIAMRDGGLLSVIAQAIKDPSMDVEKLERLYGLYERDRAEQKKQVFMSALSQLQAEIPQIDKHGRVVVKGTLRSTFAKLDDIDTIIRPLCAKFGFAFSDDVETVDAKSIKVVCKLSHEDGHSETKSVPVPIDFNEYRTGTQSVMATITLAKRHLRCMHLNIVTKDADTDGNSLEPITADQAKDIRTALADMKSDEKDFLSLMVTGVTSVEEIPARELARVWVALETKKRLQEEKARSKK